MHLVHHMVIRNFVCGNTVYFRCICIVLSCYDAVWAGAFAHMVSKIPATTSKINNKRPKPRILIVFMVFYRFSAFLLVSVSRHRLPHRLTLYNNMEVQQHYIGNQICLHKRIGMWSAGVSDAAYAIRILKTRVMEGRGHTTPIQK